MSQIRVKIFNRNRTNNQNQAVEDIVNDILARKEVEFIGLEEMSESLIFLYKLSSD